MQDTIAALASGRPPSAIAVIRLSGPQAFSGLAALVGGKLPPARRLSIRRLRCPAHGDLLDEAMVAVFPGPRTASGEDLAQPILLHSRKPREAQRNSAAIRDRVQWAHDIEA